LKKGLALATAFLLFGALVLVNGMGLGAPEGMPLVSIGPTYVMPTSTLVPSYTGSTDAVVNISDKELKAALIGALNMTPQSVLHKSDLAKLCGGLDLSGKGIVKLDGLQYCTNVTDLKLSNNKINDAGVVAALSALTGLRTLLLDGNKLTKVPAAVLSMTNLTYLSLANNQLTKVVENIDSLSSLVNLDLSGNSLTTLPTHIGMLSNIQYLNISGNKFRDVPKEIFLLPDLQSLDLSGNVLATIPDDAAKMPSLAVLNVEGNILGSLPAGLGNAPSLRKVYAARNRLTDIEASLLNGQITDLTLDVNRITALPQTLSGKTFDTFSVEWNFIDMSEGSESRTIADSVNAPSGKAYLRQLKKVESVQTMSSINTVLLQWQPLADGSDGDCIWKVSKYQIYQVNGESWKLVDELDRLAGQYVVTDLDAEKTYTFQVGVEYSLTLGSMKTGTRYFTPVDATTLGADATAEAFTPLPTATPEDDQTQEEPPDTSNTVQPSQTSAPVVTPDPGPNTGLIVVLIIVGSLLAIGLLIFVAMMMNRGRRRSY
jgi:Leucine-rich repeat (LRR) protein